MSTDTTPDSPSDPKNSVSVDRSAAISPWRNGSYRAWFVIDTTSALAASLRGLAFTLLAVAVTGSTTIAGLCGSLTIGSGAIAALFGGIVADRFDRRRVWTLGLATGPIIYGTLAILVAGGAISTPLILAFAVLAGVHDGLFGFVSEVVLRTIVAPSQLAVATATNQGRDSAISLAGPPLSGTLFALGHAIPFAGQAILDSIAALMVRFVRHDLRHTPDRTVTEGTIWSNITHGFRWIWGQRIIRAIIFPALLLNLFVNALITNRILQLNAEHTNPTVIGLIGAGAAAGTLIGAALAPALVSRHGDGRLVCIGLAWTAVFFLGFSLVTTPIPSVVTIVVAMITNPTVNGIIQGYAYHLMPAGELGRIGAALSVGSMSLTTVAPALAGLAAGSGLPLSGAPIFGIGLAATAVFVIIHPAMRSVPPASTWNSPITNESPDTTG
ncbi:MFS transporter [Williamsia sp. CHRR-6]|uniref:MFS transporter n=1 Tax=Williamsia sp. CHRR-6 TaxID=2835871 RepID=UPI001BD9462D|nr:MFS transporter [Williamsia sp. CHRR-6]MBT0565739.1 MFS transporter [Williamsia sp. CHRR-6]